MMVTTLSLECHYDYFHCGYDEIEEHALNVESCVQVLRILNTKADVEIEKLENDLLCLENDLACIEHENWPEICCSALTKRIDQLDAAVTTLKSDHTDYVAMQVLLHSKPAETLHEIMKALLEDHRQDSHGKHLDENILNVTEHAPDNGIIREGGGEDFKTSENSQSSELLFELHVKGSDDPEKPEEFLAISLVRSPDAGVVGYVPYRSEKMVLSDTLDEDVRQSQFATTDTCDQSLNLVLPKEENVCSDDYRLANIEGMNMYSHSRFGIGQQEESENSDLANNLHDFVPKTARRAYGEEYNAAPDEDLVPLQTVYPLNFCFSDTESEFDVNFSKSFEHFPSKLKAREKKKPEFEACLAREPLNSPTSVIPSTSMNVSTKRQRKPETWTAYTVLNEPTNSKITWRAMQPGQDEIDGGITNSDRVPTDNASQYNGKELSLVDYHNERSQTLMKETLVVLKSMAKKHKIKGYYKLNKADLVEELVKQFSSR
ncbi:uncharacterized protein [Medicago truncatula]|uniref:uncharacterized protein isoform X2 n=1 Tax=Medicago truncatula TaxID=3880 RepID=UPI001966D820|nr:uncharacterized protein LOC11421617 isoform X2 [Medicago truncatula]